MKKVQTVVENFINGNISDARRMAEVVSYRELIRGFFDAGWSARKSMLSARYLKFGKGWQECCDAK